MAFWNRKRTSSVDYEVVRAEVVNTIQSLFPGVGDVWNLMGNDLHPALMIPASVAAVSFVTQTIVGAEPVYEERRDSGQWRATEDIEKIPYWLRPSDHHPNTLQTYDDMIGDLVVSIMISHGGYILGLGDPGDFFQRVQTIPSWAGTMNEVDGKYTLRVSSSRELSRVDDKEVGAEYDRYDPGMGGNYLYLSMLRWGSIPYGVDVIQSNKNTFQKHISAIKTSKNFAKNPIPSMVVEAEGESDGSYNDDGASLERLKEQLASIGQDPNSASIAATEVAIRKIHELKQSVGDIGLNEIIGRAAADMGTVFGVFDTFLSAGKSSSWGTVVRDLDRIIQSHKINPLKVKLQRAFSIMTPPGFRVRFEGDGLRPETKREKSDRIGGEVDDGIKTPNEARVELGMEKDEDPISDKLRVPRARRTVQLRNEDYQEHDDQRTDE